jgi:hypothetical protein
MQKSQKMQLSIEIGFLLKSYITRGIFSLKKEKKLRKDLAECSPISAL